MVDEESSMLDLLERLQQATEIIQDVTIQINDSQETALLRINELVEEIDNASKENNLKVAKGAINSLAREIENYVRHVHTQITRFLAAYTDGVNAARKQCPYGTGMEWAQD